MTTEEFFDEPEERSVIKSTIVARYFDEWTRVMLPQVERRGTPLAYVDLFSGPGRYDDGTPSTPLWVLGYATNDPRLCERLITVFNDKDPDHARRLVAEIERLPGIERLKRRPQVNNVEVGREAIDLLRGTLVPTLFFLDPFGYKGLSLELIGTAIKSWGCDCIFFFNYNRINPGISNPAVTELMNDLFGADRAERLRREVRGLSPDARQVRIIGAVTEAMKEVGGRFVLPFEFQSHHGDRPSHYIVFVSKAFLGYHLMKEVMFSVSSEDSDVRRFRYVPVRSTQMELFPEFGRSHSIPLLMEVLARSARGKRLTVWDVYERFTVDTPYTLKNVQTALIELERTGAVWVDPPAAKRRKHRGEATLAKDKFVTFL